jgi:expansin (peptidoglycan-binding protein)
MHETHITYLQGGVPVGAARVTDYMQLANGQRVYYPEDILSVVPEASASALAAESSASARSTATTLSGVAMAAYLVGGVVMLLPILNHDVSTPINTTPIYIGGGLVLSGLVMHLAGMGYRSSANDEAATAFETYDAGLRERLSLCGHDGALGSCR